MTISRGNVASLVPPEWRVRLLRACQIRNAREIADALAEKPKQQWRPLTAIDGGLAQ
jgi:hypothetical protein